ncbi:MAG: FHA domain-containing protein [Deltaproteobacteria bacterium]|nr:FHA domain-containing protein [Deltaproteobacteria bacterium]
MFALEISFQDGVSQPEMIFLRRPQALVGASDYAHVFLEDMKDLHYQLRFLRDLGRRFSCRAVAPKDEGQAAKKFEGTYEGMTTVDLGPVKITVSALDCDLALKENETPDRAGVRVLRQACSSPSPLFPAVVVRGNTPLVMSFVPDQPIYIGRSKVCALRLDSADISARHARMGYEGGEFWIEDLGSTNGTFINQQQISGRVAVPAGTPISLGREISVLGVTSEDQIVRATAAPSEMLKAAPSLDNRYPVLLAVSEVARPARLVLQPGGTVKIGRDPSSDMWLGAPHVSRHHCSVSVTRNGSVSVTDHSTNGTAYDKGLLQRGEILEVGADPTVLDFGGSLTVAICLGAEHEKTFAASHGAVHAFHKAKESAPNDTARELAEVVGTLTGMRIPESLDPDRQNLRLRDRIVRLYRSLSFVGKVTLLFIPFAVVLMFFMIIGLVVPIFR